MKRIIGAVYLALAAAWARLAQRRGNKLGLDPQCPYQKDTLCFLNRKRCKRCEYYKTDDSHD